MATSSVEPQRQTDTGYTGPPLVIAFATQKGGMGKTTLSVLVASWLHYRRGINVTLIDVDSSQLSVYNQRLQEIGQMDEDEEMSARHNKQAIDPYLILSGSPGDVPELLGQVPAGVRLVLIDMPGSIDVDGYETAIAKLDYLIVPLETSRYAVTTGFNYLNGIRQIDLVPADRCRVLWNKFKPSRDAVVADLVEEQFKEYGFTFLSSRIPQRDSYQNPANLSTLFPMPKHYLRDSGLGDLFTEIETLLPTITPAQNGIREQH